MDESAWLFTPPLARLVLAAMIVTKIRSASRQAKASSASQYLPTRSSIASIALLRRAAADCRACDLWKHATQTVFGEGSPSAMLVLVGEQPGDREDLEGRPFVGLAGEHLDAALAEAGIDRARAYVTNAVKHFKWERRGKRRIHKKPNATEIAACRPWLDLATVHPSSILRAPDEETRRRERALFVEDLRTAGRFLRR
jgi:uracil-DNA glycosylase family protein